MSTYLLIHGAYQGGWIWKPVAERLRRRVELALRLRLLPVLLGGELVKVLLEGDQAVQVRQLLTVDFPVAQEPHAAALVRPHLVDSSGLVRQTADSAEGKTHRLRNFLI